MAAKLTSDIGVFGWWDEVKLDEVILYVVPYGFIGLGR